MTNKRADLAEKLEIIGQIFEIDGMAELLGKFEKDMSPVKFSAVMIQVAGLLFKENKNVADKIVGMNRGISDKDVQAMDDGAYATALRDAIATDVMGFFAQSPNSDGKS